MNALHAAKRRALPRGACLLLFLLGLAWAGPRAALADDPGLTLGVPVCDGERVRLSYAIAGLFDEHSVDALRSGLPATLTVEWRLWRRREAWWDSPVATGGVHHRILFDVLEEHFEVFDDAGRRIAGHAALRGVEAALCDGRELDIRAGFPLRADRSYHVEVRARLEPLDPREIRKLEDWLEGDLERKGDDIVGGVARRAMRFFRGAAGLESRQALARSAAFSGGAP